MAKFIHEVLKEINDNPSLLQTTYKKKGDGGPLLKFFHHAFVPRLKFLLPEGEPPYKVSAEPLGMTPSLMMGEIRRFYILSDPKMSSTKRETIFIQMLEGMHPLECKVLLAVKDQKLTDLYPNITAKLVADAGFIPQPPATAPAPQPIPVEPTQEDETKKKRGRGRPPGSKNKPGQPSVQ